MISSTDRYIIPSEKAQRFHYRFVYFRQSAMLLHGYDYKNFAPSWNTVFYEILINNTPYVKKNFDRRHFIENKGMPPPAHLLLDQIGEISSSFQPFHLLQPPVSVPMVSTILDKEIAHRTILPLWLLAFLVLTS